MLVADASMVMDGAAMSRAVVIAGFMGGGRAISLTLAHTDRVAGLVLDRHQRLPRASEALDPGAVQHFQMPGPGWRRSPSRHW
ncbi:MAG: hypothetical protein M0T77_15020 [Actinomycetota bacterium]|nr:hypothetical protein [Actinomycetota bacterium]